VAGLGGAIAYGVKQFTSLESAVVSLQRITGGTTAQVSGLRGAMQLSGMDTDKATTSLTQFSKKLEAAKGSGSATAEMTKTLGTSFLDANGNILPMSELLPKVADKFKTMPDGAEKTALAVQLFGKSGTAMLPFLNQGSAGIQGLTDKAAALGLVLDDTAKAKFTAFKGAVRILSAEAQGLGVQIGGTVLPLLTGAATALSNLLAPMIMKIVGLLKAVQPAIDKTGTALSNIGTKSGSVKDALGTISPVVGLLGGAFAALSSGGIAGLLARIPMLGGAFGGLLAPLGALGGPVGVAIAAFAGLAATGGDISSIVPMVTNAISGVVSVLPRLIGQVTTFVPQFVASIVAQIPSLLSAATQIVSALVQGIITAVPLLVQGALTLVQGLVQGIVGNLPQIIAAAVSLVMALVSGLVSMLPMLATSALQLVMGLATALIAALPQIIAAAIQLVMALIQGLIQMLPQLVTTAIQLVLGLVQGLIQMLPQLITAAIQLVTSLITGLIGMIPQLIQAAIQLVLGLVTGLIQALPQLIAAVPQLITGIVTGLVSNIGQIISAAIQLIVALIGGLISAIPAIVKAMPQIIAAVVNAFKGIDWGKVGRDIIQGIIDGINSMVASAKKTVSNLVGEIGKFFPHSPAKEGPLSGQGYPGYSGSKMIGDMASGMDAKQGELVAAARRAAAAAQVSVTAAAFGTSASGASGLGASGSSGSAGGVTLNYNNYAAPGLSSEQELLQGARRTAVILSGI
jgi:phage-related protein